MVLRRSGDILKGSCVDVCSWVGGTKLTVYYYLSVSELTDDGLLLYVCVGGLPVQRNSQRDI